jgi:hypothetical protein
MRRARNQRSVGLTGCTTERPWLETTWLGSTVLAHSDAGPLVLGPYRQMSSCGSWEAAETDQGNPEPCHAGRTLRRAQALCKPRHHGGAARTTVATPPKRPAGIRRPPGSRDRASPWALASQFRDRSCRHSAWFGKRQFASLTVLDPSSDSSSLVSRCSARQRRIAMCE